MKINGSDIEPISLLIWVFQNWRIKYYSRSFPRVNVSIFHFFLFHLFNESITSCIRNKDHPDEYKGKEYHGMKTMLDQFNFALRRFPNHKFLGTRDQNQPGAPYEFKTYRQVYEETLFFAKGKCKVIFISF